MKILYHTDTLYNSGGMERILISKANCLVRDYAYEVCLVTNHQRGRSTFFPLDPSVKMLDLDFFLRFSFQIPLYLKRLDKIVAAEKPDIIIDLNPRTMGKLKERYKTCVVMSEFHFCHDMFLIQKKYRRLRRMEEAVGRLDCFVVLTKEDEARWKPFCPNTVQIYNPCTFPLDGKRALLNEKHCISGGRFESQKNYTEMVDLWAHLHPRHPDWTLDLYGNGKEKKKIERKISRLGLSASIRLHPATSRIREEMLGSSIYLMTSLYEGFPLVLVECSSLGLPCVCYRCPCGPGEFIRDGVDGFTAAPNRPDQWIEKVEYLMDHPDIRKKMGSRAAEKVGDFREEAIMEQWNTLFTELVKKNNRD